MSHAAFLSAIRSAPDDDAPRLVYADFLEESGDAARAEFIRVQCELARLSPTDARRPGLEDREHELLERHERQWLGPAGGVSEWSFRRGFVDDITASPLDPPEAVFANHPVDSWSLEAARDAEGGVTYEWREGERPFDSEPFLLSVRHLDLSGYHPNIGDYVGPLHTDEPGRLESLDFAGVPGLIDLPRLVSGLPCILQLRALSAGSAGEVLPVELLASALSEAPVERLSLHDCGITRLRLWRLMAPPLRSLDLSGNLLTTDDLVIFQEAPFETQLNYLDLSATRLAVEALAPLLATPCCRTLLALEINHCDGGRSNIEALAASPYWSQAKELRARSGTLSPVALDPLCRGGSQTLGVLDVSDNHLGDRGVEMIASAQWAGLLHWLSLSRNDLSDRAARTLASGRFPNLRTLHLSHNSRNRGGITDAGVKLLADAPQLAGLRVLTLNDTAISPTGVHTVLNAPHWRLSALGVGACLLGPHAVRVLANSSRLRRLNWLDLSYNIELGGRALMPLAESPHLSPLCELDLGGIDVGDAVAAAFRGRLGPRLSL